MCVWQEQDPHSHVDPEPDYDCKHQQNGIVQIVARTILVAEKFPVLRRAE